MSHRSVGGYIVAFIAIFSLSKQIKHPSKPQEYRQSTPRHKHEEPNVKQTHVVSLPTLEMRSHAEEREYQEKRQKYNWVQPALAVLTGVAVLFSAYAAIESARQANAAEEANRPWLEIQNVSFDTITLREDLVNGRALLTYKNIGNEPAQNITMKIHEPVAVMRKYDIDNFFDRCADDITAFTVSPEIAFPSTTIVKTVRGGVYAPYPTSDDGDLIGCLFYKDSRSKQHVTIFDCPIDFAKAKVSDCVFNAAAD